MNFLEPTDVLETYWEFAHNRFEIWWARHTGSHFPWTNDPILAAHRFTNSYRILDRVSQYLVKEVQYDPTRSQAADELFFRTMLFKTFNKITTWESIERELGRVSWQSFDPEKLNSHLGTLRDTGNAIYSAAYIIPSPPLTLARKHENHIQLLVNMMIDGLPNKIHQSSSLEDMYHLILAYPGMGSFLSFQYAIDLNYSTITDHDESTFVVAGPGAIDGISKCFSSIGRLSYGDVIMEMFVNQHTAFYEQYDLPFRTLFGRPLQPIDLQNCFCETSKYTRVSHPNVKGVSGRTNIKQKYKRDPWPLPAPFLPPKWGLAIPKEFLDAYESC